MTINKVLKLSIVINFTLSFIFAMLSALVFKNSSYFILGCMAWFCALATLSVIALASGIFEKVGKMICQQNQNKN